MSRLYLVVVICLTLSILLLPAVSSIRVPIQRLANQLSADADITTHISTHVQQKKEICLFVFDDDKESKAGQKIIAEIFKVHATISVTQIVLDKKAPANWKEKEDIAKDIEKNEKNYVSDVIAELIKKRDAAGCKTKDHVYMGHSSGSAGAISVNIRVKSKLGGGKASVDVQVDSTVAIVNTAFKDQGVLTHSYKAYIVACNCATAAADWIAFCYDKVVNPAKVNGISGFIAWSNGFARTAPARVAIEKVLKFDTADPVALTNEAFTALKAHDPNIKFYTVDANGAVV